MSSEEKTSKVDLVELLLALRESLLKTVDVISAYLAKQTPPAVKADELRDAFPQDLRDLLEFNVEGECCIIKPRQYLGSENFARIAAVVRGKGGNYISAGRQSHFKVPVESGK